MGFKSFTQKLRESYAILFLGLCHLASSNASAQFSHKVLFLGNSYTGVNNLPQLIHNVAFSAGDTLVFDSHTPGGYRLINHSLDLVSLNKIMAGGWDYVVIQGQSQEPVVLPGQFANGGLSLYNLIKSYSPCAVVMPYMTWGRKNGDAANCANFPVMCTYQGMDSALRARYLNLTASLNGEVSPVSVVWNRIRQQHPNIELYDPDESHPSAAGSYAAACCFYAAIFKKDPTLITYNFGLNMADATSIRAVAKLLVFDSLQNWDFKKMPVSEFGFQTGSGVNEKIFNALGQNVKQTYAWDFGDGATASLPNINHSYQANGTYTVSLTTSTCDLQGLHTSTTDTVIQFCSHTPTVFTSGPVLCDFDTLWTQVADSYLWLNNGIPLPETDQYLPDYARYSTSGFSVVSTSGGCAELSPVYSSTPNWSGYFFDALGNPCLGDTVAFAVLHINGTLSGLENILWFKNDTLLPSMTNEDTLFIASPGKYKCKVVDPNSNCPLDTTSYEIEYDCSVTGIVEKAKGPFWKVFPNPASETITFQFAAYPAEGTIQIYDALGLLTRSVTVTTKTMEIDIAGLPKGLYHIRLENNNQPILKFIKL